MSGESAMQPKLNDLLDTAARALERYGASHQELKFYEETAELTLAMRHGYARQQIRGEAADVIIMAMQMLVNACDEPGDAEKELAWKMHALNVRLRVDKP